MLSCFLKQNKHTWATDIYSIQQNIQTLLPIKQTLLFSDVTAVVCHSYAVMSVRRRVGCLDKDHLANNPSPYALNRYIKNNTHFIYSAALSLCRCCVSNPNIACSVQKSNVSFFFLFEDILNPLGRNGCKQT